MRLDTFVSVVVPIRDDNDILEPFLSELASVLRENYRHSEIVLVDDGSEDDLSVALPLLLARFDGVRVIRLSRAFGEEVAIAAGLDVVIGDYVVVMRANEDPPALVADLVSLVRAGADIVYGVRLHRDDEPRWYRFGARLFYWYLHRVVRLRLPANTTQFRCMSRQVVNVVTQIRDRHRYLRLLLTDLGFRQRAFQYQPMHRRGRIVRHAGDAINLALALVADNSIHPLRLVSWMGVAAAFANLLYAVYVIVIWVSKEDVAAGWVTLSLQSALQFFLVALILTTLCEYVGRIFSRLRAEPGYHVLAEQQSAVLLREDRRNVVRSAQSEGFQSGDAG